MWPRLSGLCVLEARVGKPGPRTQKTASINRIVSEIHDAAVASSAREHEFCGDPVYWVVKYLGRGFSKMTAAVSAAVVSARFLSRADENHGREAEAEGQADLLRDIFGDPFRPVVYDPEWRTQTVLARARQMYDSREFSAMPILADALQDEGCNNDDVLTPARAGAKETQLLDPAEGEDGRGARVVPACADQVESRGGGPYRSVLDTSADPVTLFSGN